MSSHVSNAFASELSAFFRSAGRSWTTPPKISFLLRAWFPRTKQSFIVADTLPGHEADPTPGATSPDVEDEVERLRRALAEATPDDFKADEE